MLSYNDLYEILRKEKYSEPLQPLSKSFVKEVSEFLLEKKSEISSDSDMFGESVLKSKKQLENSLAIFKELILRRKKKLLNLVFVASETGIMKTDFENMLSFEKETFDNFLKSFDEYDKKLASFLKGEGAKKVAANKMVLFSQDVGEFVANTGENIGPFKEGELANLKSDVSEVLVSGGMAQFVDE
tara:strand:+ start:90 stop:647 length:558 start_codon:yes stop_codon:yes gene_type:complete